MQPIRDLIIDFLHKTREFGLEYSAKRFYSKYEGQVKENIDLSQQGRVKISTHVAGGAKTVGTEVVPETMENYAYPSSPFAGTNYGFYFPPEIGDNVWVWFEHGKSTIPNYSGGWWKNRKENLATTEIPAEFVAIDGIPTRRGIKTKRGHGLMFDDNATTPTVQLWTGSQAIPTIPGKEAIKNQHIVLSDNPTGAGISLTTATGHQISMEDNQKRIKIAAGKEVAFRRNDIVIDDFLGTIFIKNRANTIVTLAPDGATIASEGTIKLAAAKGVTTTCTNPASIVTETGAGTKVSTFVGAVIENVGSLAQTIAGLWNVTAQTIEITAQVIKMGSTGQKFALVNENIITDILSHTHPGLNAPPNAGTMPNIATGSVKTAALKAN